MKGPSKVIGFFVIGLAFVLLLGCVGNAPSVPESKALQKVSIRFPIPTSEAAFASFYAAKEKGFYAEEGLDVTFNYGSPELNPVKMVVTKADDFGLAGGPDLVLTARGKGQPVKALAVFHQNANFVVLMTKADSGLKALKDLEGKKVGFYYGHISTDILHSLFHKENVHVEEVDVGFDVSQFIRGSIDAEFAFRQSQPLNLAAKGIQTNLIDPADYGVISHGYTLFAREDFIRENPVLVEKFVRATLRGLQFSRQQPEESIDLLIKDNPQLDRTLELGRIPFYNTKVSTDPYGKMDHEMFQMTLDRLMEEKVIEKPIVADDAFDASFVNKIDLRD